MRTKLFVAVSTGVLLGVGLFGLFIWWGSRIVAEPEHAASPALPKHEIIGHSVEGRDIEAYTYGAGATRIGFVGGVHGGYEWNSTLLAYTLMDYLAEHPESIPANVSVSVVPSANPDGLYAILGAVGRFAAEDVPDTNVPSGTGRFNARGVDLNRNFDCKWKPESLWRNQVVSAGSVAFSEPEARALRDFVLNNNPTAMIFFHSQANAVYASECEDGILPETRVLMNAYSHAAGYPSVDSFDSYAISGDAEGWLASIGIPAITVELKTHETVEWDKNLAGVRALFAHFGGASLSR